MTKEQEKCKQSGIKLYNQLKSAGHDLTGVGIGLSEDKQSPTIRINFKTKPKKNEVPNIFEGYEVKIVVTGIIKPLNV